MGEAKTPTTLLLACCECGKVEEMPIDGEKFEVKRIYREKGWVMSTQAKDKPRRVMLVPVCDECAPKVMSAELLAAARRELER